MYTIIKVINADKVYKYHFFFFYFDEKESHFFSVKADMTFSSTSVSHFFDMQGHYWYISLLTLHAPMVPPGYGTYKEQINK